MIKFVISFTKQTSMPIIYILIIMKSQRDVKNETMVSDVQ